MYTDNLFCRTTWNRYEKAGVVTGAIAWVCLLAIIVILAVPRILRRFGRFKMDGWMDGWMACDFMSFSTVFQSYQDGGRLIMNGCVQWSSFYG